MVKILGEEQSAGPHGTIEALVAGKGDDVNRVALHADRHETGRLRAVRQERDLPPAA